MGQTKTAVIEGTEVKSEPQAAEEKATSTKRKEPKVRGKNYKQAKTKIDKNKIYTISAALELLSEMSYTKFDPTVELHIKTKKGNVNTSLTLPNSTGKSKKIELANEATIKKLKSGKIDFDVLLATGEMMPKLVPFAKILGPKGLMPNPKNGTLLKDAKDAKKFSADKVTLKTEKNAPLIHTTVGKLSIDKEKLSQNIEAIFDSIGRKQIVSAHLAASMTPSVRVEID
jgi:large subunit ribosomal protein L1